MNPPSQLNMVGVFCPLSTEAGFAIPVFTDNSDLWVQEVDQSGKVVEFVRCDVQEESLLRISTNASGEPFVQRVGNESLHAFQMLDGRIEVGQRSSESLVKAMNSIRTEDNPFVSLDVAEFLGDSERELEARAACDRLLSVERQLPQSAALTSIHITDVPSDSSTSADSTLDPLPIKPKTKAMAVGKDASSQWGPISDTSRPHLAHYYYNKSAVALAAVLVIGALIGTYYFYPRPFYAPVNSLAILPFSNDTNDPNRDFVTDGMTENLITNFTQLPELRVVSRSGAFRFKSSQLAPQQYGRQLNVQAVLTGRLLSQVGDSLKMQVALVDTRNDAQLWSREYEFENLVAVQQDISRQLVEKLHLKLSDAEKIRLTSRDTRNTDAYLDYLKGRYYWNRRSADDLNSAIEEFEKAVEKILNTLWLTWDSPTAMCCWKNTPGPLHVNL